MKTIISNTKFIEPRVVFRGICCSVAIVACLVMASPTFAQGKGKGGKGGGGGGGGGVPDPTVLVDLDITTSEIEVGWISAGGSTAGFIVAYKQDGMPRKKCRSGTQIDVGNVGSFKITGLDYDSSYGIRVCAYNDSGDRSNGITLNSSTLEMVSMQIKQDESGSGLYDRARNFVPLSDGGMLVAANIQSDVNGNIETNSALIRYNEDGSRNTNFSGDGMVNLGNGDNQINVVEISTGKFVAIARFADHELTALRYNSDGTLDEFTNFLVGSSDFDGAEARDVVELSDGKILILGQVKVGGFNSVLLARLNPDMSLDTSFGVSGNVVHTYPTNTDAYRFALQADDKVVVSGYSIDLGLAFVARYDSDGLEDYAKVLPSIDHRSYHVAIDPFSGGAIFGGREDPVAGDDTQCEVFKLDTNGDFDTNWGDNGFFHFNPSPLGEECSNVAIDSQGRVYLAGLTEAGIGQDYMALRLNADGTIDTSWGDNGVYVMDGNGGRDEPWDAHVDSQDRLVIAGNAARWDPYDTFIIRMNQ